MGWMRYVVTEIDVLFWRYDNTGWLMYIGIGLFSWVERYVDIECYNFGVTGWLILITWYVNIGFIKYVVTDIDFPNWRYVDIAWLRYVGIGLFIYWLILSFKGKSLLCGWSWLHGMSILVWLGMMLLYFVILKVCWY